MDNQKLDRLTDKELQGLLNPSCLPRHVALIMDGNGRWATQRGLPRLAGHREGVYSAREAATICVEMGISALTLYAFSLENWKRPQKEIAMLMDLFCEYFHSESEHFLKERIRFRAIGRLELLPNSVQTMIRELEEATQMGNRLTVTLALSYGGRAEIVDAVKRVLTDVTKGMVQGGGITEGLFSQYLETADLPDPDLLIRTSGETRVSNFLLWQIAYAELYFTKTLWPDFRRREMLLALLDYQKRERRLGGLNNSLRSPSQSSRFVPHGPLKHSRDKETAHSIWPVQDPIHNMVGASQISSCSFFGSSWLD
jgi:undecaprenyl diphosphate synthase